MMFERVVMNSTQEVKFDLFLGKMNSERINCGAKPLIVSIATRMLQVELDTTI